jgi:non-ribosomal peptide synthetase component F
MQDRFELGADDRVLQKTPAGFDVSVWEFFWPLIAGAGLVMARPGGHRDPAYLAEVVVDQRITTMHFVPSMLAAFLESGGLPGPGSLRRVVCSGEALPPALAAEFLRRFPGVRLENLYGPTEAAVDVTYHECRPGEDVVPIGRPVWNTQVQVLDQFLRPARAGELYLGGVQLADGYLGRAGLTASRFVAGAQGRRRYRTGDLVRWSGDELVYLGRTDDQGRVG